jgi:steroid delta-isomerase-like uncharacterized protein
MDAAVVEPFFAALNSGHGDDLDNLLTEDFVFEEVAGAGAASRDALKAELEAFRTALPDISFRPVRVARDGQRIYLEFRAMGTHRGAFLNVSPTNTFAIVSGVFNVALQDGQIARLRLTVDFAGLRRQLLQAARHR